MDVPSGELALMVVSLELLHLPRQQRRHQRRHGKLPLLRALSAARAASCEVRATFAVHRCRRRCRRRLPHGGLVMAGALHLRSYLRSQLPIPHPQPSAECLSADHEGALELRDSCVCCHESGGARGKTVCLARARTCSASSSGLSRGGLGWNHSGAAASGAALTVRCRSCRSRTSAGRARNFSLLHRSCARRSFNTSMSVICRRI